MYIPRTHRTERRLWVSAKDKIKDRMLRFIEDILELVQIKINISVLYQNDIDVDVDVRP